MPTIIPNRQGLKDLADLSIDGQFSQQYGSQVFNYQGDSSSAYQQTCSNFNDILQDILDDVAAIQTQIPAFNHG